MPLNVKKKIWYGTLFLFVLLIVTGGVSVYQLVKLKSKAKVILQDNYESLSYCHTMLEQLNLLSAQHEQSVLLVEDALRKQEENVTEKGEQTGTANVRASFNKLKSGDSTTGTLQALQKEIHSIVNVNMKAIRLKNNRAEITADKSLTYIITLTGVVFIISFTFIINFPSIITEPIGKLSEAIREIAQKNYKHRVHITNKDEFGTLADAFNEMAERLEYFESSNLNKLMFEKNRAEAVINSLKDASIGIDKNGIVLFANYQALQLLGLASEEVVGKPVDELKSRNDLFSFLIDKESTTPFKIVVENRENYFVKEVIEVQQENAKNKVIVLRNITSFKELDVAKTNFISTISHELKTPLASSDISLKLLEDDRVSQLTSMQKEWVLSLKEDNQRMLKILSELLNMAQVEAGKIQLNIQKVDPAQIVEDAMQAVSGNATAKEISIIDKSGKALPAIFADADKTTWVLNNFLTNAIKYSHRGSSIEVGASLSDDKVIFSVRDHGPGISEDYIPRLFERYFQVPGSKEKGSGIGLAISKEFVEAQGGGIWVESEVGRGSVFNFSLPITKL